MDVGQSQNLATALVPPSSVMISDTVMPISVTENRNAMQEAFSGCVIYPPEINPQLVGVMTTADLLARLEDRGVRNVDIAKALNVTPSRVTEIKKGDRAIKLDEAVKLVQAFQLEPSQQVPALPLSVLRLVVLHVARRLGAEMREEQVADLAADLRAFSIFAADPKVRGSIQAAEGFFQALQLRHPEPEEEAPSGSDPAPTH